MNRKTFHFLFAVMKIPHFKFGCTVPQVSSQLSTSADPIETYHCDINISIVIFKFQIIVCAR